MNWAKVTDLNDKELRVNLDTVRYMTPLQNTDGTCLDFIGNDDYYLNVKEPVEVILLQVNKKW